LFQADLPRDIIALKPKLIFSPLEEGKGINRKFRLARWRVTEIGAHRKAKAEPRQYRKSLYILWV
jgi:hypothetical protein